MDEMEKYQQRIQAIAEKRQIQEAQERARRELEEEKLRLQQLKRKSLRDQWLMEGPPISPDASGPRSPLWSLQAQDMEKQIENLQTKTLQLEEKVAQHMGHSSEELKSDSITHDSDCAAEEEKRDNQEPIVQNGHGNRPEASGIEVKSTHQSTEPNGEEAETGAVTSSAVRANGVVQQPLAQDTPPTTNGPTGEVLPGGITLTFLGFSEVGPGESTSVDEEGGAIMRAERVVIADEVEDDIEEDTPGSLMEEFTLDVAESNSPSKTQEEHAESVEKCYTEPVAPDQGSDGTEKKTEDDEENTTEARRSPGPPEARRSPGPPEARRSPGPPEARRSPGPPEARRSPGPPEARRSPGPPEARRSPGPPEARRSPGPPEARRSPGPPEARRSPGPPKAKVSSPAESVELVKEEPKSSALPQGPPIPGRFHEIPLDGSRSEPRVEEEPLLVSKVSPLTNDESRVEAVGAPKRKTCQCCSVM
ncbi:paralemmin-3 isoform X2 [Denticeps clupeoides]|uniref:paralemmin-3 isoform X2 n=1 Tax=Denticeps clupeoides TaxID=299321 RepID=UPI0010A2ADCE|nr:paralemmin-3-like isoform X2 [Denticeps clupeoides]